MWYRINMDLSNQKSQENLNKLFGHTEWQSQSFLQHPPSKRERGFVDYLLKQIGNQHHAVRIPMPFSPEDQVPGENRGPSTISSIFPRTARQRC